MTQATTRHPIRIGVQLRQQHTTYQSYADAVRRAEDLGVDTIWDWDHFFPLTGDPQGSNFEGWTLLPGVRNCPAQAGVSWAGGRPRACPSTGGPACSDVPREEATCCGSGSEVP